VSRKKDYNITLLAVGVGAVIVGIILFLNNRPRSFEGMSTSGWPTSNVGTPRYGGITQGSMAFDAPFGNSIPVPFSVMPRQYIDPMTGQIGGYWN